MFLEVQKNWEIRNPLMTAINGEDVRLFPMLRVPLDRHLFHVDLLISDNDGENAFECIDRLICTDIRQAIHLTEQEEVKRHKIAVQTRRCDNEDIYIIDDITEIFVVEYESEHRNLMFCCKSGKKVFDKWSEEPKSYRVLDMLYSSDTIG